MVCEFVSVIGTYESAEEDAWTTVGIRIEKDVTMRMKMIARTLIFRTPSPVKNDKQENYAND